MGMDPFNFSDALLGILAQRLAKRLCPKCKVGYTPDAAELNQFFAEYCAEMVHTAAYAQNAQAALDGARNELKKKYADAQGRITFYRAAGCGECGNTGYRGRIGLHELMLGSDRIKRLIQEHARVADLFAAALDDGMRTLKMDGMEKVMQGATDMHQVRAVCIK